MGTVATILSQSFPPKPQWTTDNIPDLSGKVVIVTGGNEGIGKETCKALLAHHAKVYLAARNESRATTAIAELKQATGKDAIWLKLDLADLKSVKAAAEQFQSQEQQLHVLFNNAGVMACPIDMVTAQNYDLQFGTNVLGHFYFTQLLLPVLISTAKTTPEGKVRVVNTSSSAAYNLADKNVGFNLDLMKDGSARRKIGTWSLYGQSKLGNVVFANELARRYGDQGIISTSLNPGNLRTNLGRHMSNFRRTMLRPLTHPAPLGALTQLWAGTSPEGVELQGQFLVPWARKGPTPAHGNDAALGKELWKWCEEQVKEL